MPNAISHQDQTLPAKVLGEGLRSGVWHGCCLADEVQRDLSGGEVSVLQPEVPGEVSSMPPALYRCAVGYRSLQPHSFNR